MTLPKGEPDRYVGRRSRIVGLNRRTIVVIGIIVVALGVLLFTQKHRVSVYLRSRPMSIHDRVVVVVQNWVTAPSRPDDTQQLEVLWASSGRSFAFYPDAAQVLARNLQTEFRDSNTVVLRYTDLYASGANTAAKVKTVGDLATAVRQNYTPQ